MSAVQFFSAATKGEHHPSMTVTEDVTSACQPGANTDVGVNRLSDDGREELIGIYAQQMEDAYQMAEKDGANYFFWMGHALHCKQRMYVLIKERSPDRVRSMELARGLA
jgi:hypothetical protein